MQQLSFCSARGSALEEVQGACVAAAAGDRHLGFKRLGGKRQSDEKADQRKNLRPVNLLGEWGA